MNKIAPPSAMRERCTLLYGNSFKVHHLSMTRLLFFILLLPTVTFGQTINTTDKSGRRNIYNDAISRYITLVSKSDKSIFDTLLLFKDDLLTDSLQTTIQKTRIMLLDSTDISNRLERDDSFIGHRIFPLSFDNGQFYINIVPFRVHKDKNGIALGNTGTCVVSYHYDTNKKSFRFYRSACNGF
ncbi:hypothetical protein FC093_23265 [Ilyomonas limi]|uniref:Uncharacterized protein n=2 Tax=Ilyomonas limi TaxID=2575867 RepID=A0A4U3KR58_9BACT|nr:hypothetical protein FC093_23265 [Ilyomonas limi]